MNDAEVRVALFLLHSKTDVPTSFVPYVAKEVVRCADAFGVHPALLLAIMHVESRYRYLSVSPVGAQGLMQLMPSTAKWVASKLDLAWDGDAFHPTYNVRLGAWYIAHLLDTFGGDRELALTAYNRGPRATKFIVAKFKRLPAHVLEVYAEQVLDRFDIIKAMVFPSAAPDEQTRVAPRCDGPGSQLVYWQ